MPRFSELLLIRSFRAWKRDRCAGLAAAISYFALLSVAPFFYCVLFLVRIFVGQDRMQSSVLPALGARYGEHAREILHFLYRATEQKDAYSLSISFASYVGLLVAASAYFSQIKDSLETIWGQYQEDFGLKAELRNRGMGALMSLIVTLLYAVLVAVQVVFRVPIHLAFSPRADFGRILPADVAGGFALTFATNAALYLLFIPERIRFRLLLRGAALTALIQIAGRIGATATVARIDLSSAAGAGGAILLFLLWTYYASLAFLFGAEVTHQLAAAEKPSERRLRGVA